MLNTMYELYFVQTKLRLKIFAMAAGVGVIASFMESILFRRPEYDVTRDVSILVLIFLFGYQFLTVAFRDSPTLPWFSERMRTAKCLYASSRISEALSVYSNLLTQAPVSASRRDRLELLVSSAAAYRTAGDSSVALSLLEQARSLSLELDDRIHPVLLYLLASVHFELGHTKQAIIFLEKFIGEHTFADETRMECLFYLFTCYRDIGDLGRAQFYQQKTLAIRQLLPDLYLPDLDHSLLSF